MKRPPLYLPRIKETRVLRGYTQKEIAAYLDIKQNSYCNIENGNRYVSLFVVQKLAIFYGISADYLVGLSDDPIIRSPIDGVLNTLPSSSFSDE